MYRVSRLGPIVLQVRAFAYGAPAVLSLSLSRAASSEGLVVSAVEGADMVIACA